MKKVFLFFIVIVSFSCDDGNLDIPEFNFSSIDVDDCGDVVLFKINENETLVIEIDPRLSSDEDTFLTFNWDNKAFSVTEGGTNRITYRTLAEKPTANYFCQNIPPTSPAVLTEWTGTGNVLVDTDLTIDDNDNVVEEVNDDVDFDQDGIPDYKDSDDDGDDISTLKEDVDGDGDPTNDDTDGDGKPNYLDDDDDEDGTPTKEESTTEDANGNGIVDYLDPGTLSTIGSPRILKNSYEELYKTTIIIEPLKLINSNGAPINYDRYEFGTIETSKTKTPN